MSPFTVTVNNQSGQQQQYALLNQPPSVVGASGTIFSHAFSTANSPPGSYAEFEVWPQHYAIVGSSRGSMTNGARVDISAAKPVDLGVKGPGGSLKNGTSLAMKVMYGAPQFDNTPLPNGGFADCFEIKVGGDFTADDARQGRFIIGVGASKTGNTHDGPAATLMPEPNMNYQIKPSSTYYLTYGSYKEGSVVDVSTVGPSATIQFSTATPNYIVTHNEQGKLTATAGSPGDE